MESFMQTLIATIREFIPMLAIISLILIPFLLITIVMRRREPFRTIHAFIRIHGKLIAWIIATIATVGSMFYSNVLGFAPCPLCWWQRVFMYPLVVLIPIALLFRLKDMVGYVFPLALIGWLIAGYHYVVQRTGIETACAALEEGVACTARYIYSYGFVSIPLLAFLAFSLIMLVLLIHSRK